MTRNSNGLKRIVAIAMLVGLGALWVASPAANATPFNVEIVSPAAVTQVAPGGTVDVTVRFDESHVCGSYFSNIYISEVGGQPPASPLVHEEFEYVPGVDIPDQCSGPARTHTFTHTLTVPLTAADGFYSVDLFVDEDFFGSRCCGSWAATRVDVIEVVTPQPVGDCPAEPSGYVLTQMSHAADANGDGFVCVKEVKGNGKGNQGDGTNVIDNDV